MAWLGQVMLDPICLADHVEAHLPRICCVSVARLLGEMDVVVRQDRMGAISFAVAPAPAGFPGKFGSSRCHT